MILADKIINERKKNGWSQEELADMLGVSRQSVSKWESAQSVPDLNRVLQLADIFGVSTDYLLKDEIDVEEISEHTVEAKDSKLYRLTMEEVNDFIDVKRKTAPKIAFATGLCINCPLVLIVLVGLAEDYKLLSENLAAGIGMITLFLMVASAVAIFIMQGVKLEKFKYITQGFFETEYGVDGYVKNLLDASTEKTTMKVVVGVVLCILSVVPLLIAGLAEATDTIYAIFVGVMLILVSLAVYQFIIVGSTTGAYKAILQVEDFAVENKKAEDKMAPIAAAYWCVVLAGYLLVSFLTSAWHITWVVWPVAAILYAAVASIARAAVNRQQ